MDAVIGLSSNIFYGISIPTSILVLKKKREHSENILFIDASQYFEKVKTQNVLRPADIEKIIGTYKERKPYDKYSYVAPLSEIAENAALKDLEKEIKNTDNTIAQYCKE